MSTVGTDCNSMGLYEIPTTTTDLYQSLALSSFRFVAPIPLYIPCVSPLVLSAPFRVGEQIIRLISADN